MTLSPTGIEYAVNLDDSKGFAWNFLPGCLHKPTGVCPVPNCWAESMWKRKMGAAAKSGITLPDFHHPHLILELLLAPLSVKKPSTILVNFMGDGFGGWIHQNRKLTIQGELDGITLKETVFYVMKSRPQHTFLFLTKNPKGLIPWSPFPDNAWVGVSVCNQQMFVKAIVYLSSVNAKHKWLSFEPLLEEIYIGGAYDLEGISWVVIGAQSNPVNYPDNKWVKHIVEAADQAEVKVWLKENLGEFIDGQVRRPSLRQERPF